jgi:formate hydrogenlyase subunit 4
MTGFLLVLLSALFFPGLVLKTKSICSGRKGPGIFQPMRDIWLLFRKGAVIGTGTGWIFQMAPLISFASLLCAALLVPFPGQKSLFAFQGDFVLFAYLLAVGKFFSILGALDTGSSFEGMGAAREALYSMLAEPAFFIIMGSLSLFSGYFSFSQIMSNILFDTAYSYVAAFLAVYVLVKLSMIENSRLPVDDPKTHLELTMKHEVMVLDYSGFLLGIIQSSNALRFSLFGGLISNILIPGIMPGIPALLLFFILQGIFAISVGLLESFRARNQMSGNPQFVLTLSSIALLAFVLVLILTSEVVHLTN